MFRIPFRLLIVFVALWGSLSTHTGLSAATSFAHGFDAKVCSKALPIVVEKMTQPSGRSALGLPSLWKFADGTATDADLDAVSDASDRPEGGVPDLYLVTAVELYLSRGGRHWISEGVNILRLLVLTLPEDTIRRNRALVAKENLPQSFQDEFDSVILWGTIMRRSPKLAYREAKHFLAKGAPLFSVVLGEALLDQAADNGIPQAGFELAQRWFADSPPVSPTYSKDNFLARSKLQSAAGENYLPAQMDIAMRYLEGRGFEQNKAAAYYWLLRAKANGAYVGDMIAEVVEVLTPEDRHHMEYLLKNGYSPD